jgi:hypothetical protein
MKDKIIILKKHLKLRNIKIIKIEILSRHFKFLKGVKEFSDIKYIGNIKRYTLKHIS